MVENVGDRQILNQIYLFYSFHANEQNVWKSWQCWHRNGTNSQNALNRFKTENEVIFYCLMKGFCLISRVF